MRTEVEELAEKLERWSDVIQAHDEASEVMRKAATALRAQAERVRVLEGENADTIVRWCARMAEIREASGVGVKPMLDEVPGAIAERIAAAEARAEAAERRAGELEAERDEALMIAEGPSTLKELASLAIENVAARHRAETRVVAEMEYANASRNIAARLHGALAEIARGDVPPEKEGHYLAHREVVRIARAALLPATQAEGEK